MSDKPLPSFRSIAAPLDADDEALNAINAQLGVPTLTRPATVAKPAPLVSPAPMPGRAPLEKLTIEVPHYLADAVRRAALDERTTVRHVVMLALRRTGFSVTDADLVEDGRRTRHKRS